MQLPNAKLDNVSAVFSSFTRAYLLVHKLLTALLMK